MKQELMTLKQLTIEGENGNRLHDLELRLAKGECICMISAVHQKEVLVEYLSGKGRRLHGSVFLGGREIVSSSRETMEKEKIFSIGFHTPYMTTLSVAENIFLLRRNSLKKIRLNESAMELQTRYYFEKYGIDIDLKSDSSAPGAGDRMIIGVIRGVSQGAKVIILHDASRAFAGSGVKRLLSLLSGLKRDGVGVLISDNYPELFYPISDQVVIFRHREIAKKIYEFSEFGLAHEIMIREIAQSEGQKARKGEIGTCEAALVKAIPEEEEAQVKIEGLVLNGCSCQIRGRKGEIVLVRCDETEMERIWAQLMNFSEKKITYRMNGQTILYHSMTELIKQRITFLNAEMPYGGVMEHMSQEDNILMLSYPRISTKVGFYKKGAAYIFRDSFLFGEGKSLSTADMGENNWKTVFYRLKLYHPSVLISYHAFTIADMRQRDWMKENLLQLASRGTTVILLENESSCCQDFADRIETMENEDK